MNIALVDDCAADLEALKTVLREYAAIHGTEYALTLFSSGEALLREYQPFRYAVIFMDIYMEGRSGVEIAAAVRNVDRSVILVFLTTSGEHLADAFLCHAFDYVRKPLDAGQIFRVMDDILAQVTPRDVPRLSFSAEGREHSLAMDEIVTVRTDSANYLTIRTRDGAETRVRMTFSAALEQLDGRFLQVLRGVAVNMDDVVAFDGGRCRTSDGECLPVSVRKGKELARTWQNYVFARIREEAARRAGV